MKNDLDEEYIVIIYDNITELEEYEYFDDYESALEYANELKLDEENSNIEVAIKRVDYKNNEEEMIWYYE